jgi:predicted DNA binding CopG/RHH family protein
LGPQENICTHTHKQTTQKDDERTQKEQVIANFKTLQKKKSSCKSISKEKKACVRISHKRMFTATQREIERGRRRLRQAAKKSLQVL